MFTNAELFLMPKAVPVTDQVLKNNAWGLFSFAAFQYNRGQGFSFLVIVGKRALKNEVHTSFMAIEENRQFLSYPSVCFKARLTVKSMI